MFHISRNADIYLELFVLLRSDIYLRESKGGVVCKCDIFGVISTGLLRRQKQERSDKKSERNIRRYATLPTVCLIQSDVLWERHWQNGGRSLSNGSASSDWVQTFIQIFGMRNVTTNSLGFHVILQLFEGHCSYLRGGVLTVIQLGIYGKGKTSELR